MSRFLCSVLSLCALVACGGGAVAKKKKRTSSSCAVPKAVFGMVAGTAVGETHPGRKSAVSLKRTNNRICSGVLVAASSAGGVVVTSAGCAKGDFGANGGSIIFGDDANAPDAADLRTVEGFLQSTDYQEFTKNDIMWVKFSGAVPAGVEPVKVLSDSSALTVGKELTAVGFGQTATNGGTTGAPLTVTLPVLKVPGFSSSSPGVGILGSSPNKGACVGDEGGPLYVQVNNEWVLAGIIMGQNAIQTPQAMTSSNAPDCNYGEVAFSAFSEQASWIETSASVSLTKVTSTGSGGSGSGSGGGGTNGGSSGTSTDSPSEDCPTDAPTDPAALWRSL